MSTASSAECVDCLKFKLSVRAVEASRCRRHREAYRRWYKAAWKATKAGSPSSGQGYVAEPVFVEQINVTPEALEVLLKIRGDLDVATRKLNIDMRGYRGPNFEHVAAARELLAGSSEQIAQLLAAMSQAKRTVPVDRPRGARRPSGSISTQPRKA